MGADGGHENGDGPGWSFETLRIHLSSRIDNLRLYHDQSTGAMSRWIEQTLKASDKAIAKSETSVDRRLEALNEFRTVLGDQQSTFIRRDEFNGAHASLVERVDQLQARLDRSEGKGAGLTAGWLYLVAAISTVGAVVTIVILVTGR